MCSDIMSIFKFIQKHYFNHFLDTGKVVVMNPYYNSWTDLLF